MRLLLVEDHVPLADELLASLTQQGYAVDWLADGRDAAYQGATEPYDLIILDLGLPGNDCGDADDECFPLSPSVQVVAVVQFLWQSLYPDWSGRRAGRDPGHHLYHGRQLAVRYGTPWCRSLAAGAGRCQRHVDR